MKKKSRLNLSNGNIHSPAEFRHQASKRASQHVTITIAHRFASILSIRVGFFDSDTKISASQNFDSQSFSEAHSSRDHRKDTQKNNNNTQRHAYKGKERIVHTPLDRVASESETCETV